MLLAAQICCVVVEFAPLVFGALSSPLPLLLIDTMGVFDNATTAFNFMEESYGKFRSPIHAVLVGMCVNVAGGVCRHFVARGYAEGAATFDNCLRSNLAYSVVVNSAYCYFALRPCASEGSNLEGSACVQTNDVFGITVPLYEWLALLAAIRNALPTLRDAMKTAPKPKLV